MSNENKNYRHPLIETLATIKGNPRIVLYTEPLWIIPFNLYLPFASVYMAALLLTDRQIGLIASIFMFFRAVSALFSGAITDKLGRKLTTFIFDTVSWSIPCLLWAFSQNFWWFMIAASFNGLMQITDNSWTCLLVEDTEKGSLVKIYSLLHMIAQLAVFFAPLAAILVNEFSVVPAMRILYFFSFISMTTKFILLYRYGDETGIGRTRMQETAGMSIWKIMRGYGEIFKRLFSSRDMILALVITTIFNIIWLVSGNFFGLYVTRTLLIPEHFLAYFPILRAVISVTFLYLLQPKLERLGFRFPMLIGLFLYAASTFLLINTPEIALTFESILTGSTISDVLLNFLSIDSLSVLSGLLVLAGFILIDSIGYCFVAPRSDSLIQILIEPSERARIRGLMMVIVLGFTIPFGYLAGWLSEINRRYPFILIVAFIILIFIIIAASKKRLEIINKSVG